MPQRAMSTKPDLDSALHQLGYDAFRPGQREAVETLLEDGRVLLVAPTGGGKSLCYQLPAMLLPGTSLIISPLIALMADQVAALEARGVAATFLASTLDAATIRERLEKLARGDYKLVYIAPERLGAPQFRQVLNQLQVPMIAVDEAHCISEWGHDFRPEYMDIGRLVAELAPDHVMACTATATPVVRDEILVRLGLPPDTAQLVRGFARPNLALRATEVASAAERRRLTDESLVEALGGPGKGRGTAIIYAGTRKGTEAEAERLHRNGWHVAPYHAGLSSEERSRSQQAFIDGELEIVVATNAFGMGIDRGDVRAVIHLAPPGSVEAYYQEVGRAGRDGTDAIGLMCWQQADLPKRRRLLEWNDEGGEHLADIIDHKWNLFLELIRWAEGGSCRHDAILRYFGDEAETLAGCGRCDVCLDVNSGQVDAEEATLLARKLLSGVARLGGRFGLKQVVRLLHGEPEDRLARMGLTETPTFGILRERSNDWITRALGRCVTAGWIRFSGDEHPVVALTDDGVAVMRGQRPARWIPPPDRSRSETRQRARTEAVHDDSLSAADRDLFEALRAERLRLAQEKGVPAYVVAHDRTLRELATLRPGSMEALSQVPGLGPKKAERYGEAFLDVIALNS